MRFYFYLILFTFFVANGEVLGQDEHAFYIKDIYENTLEDGKCDAWLEVLSDSIGGRLAGSQNATNAVEYTKRILESISIVDTVYKQPCVVPRWERGEKEIVTVKYGQSTMNLNALALGNSIGTGPLGLEAEVVEVYGLDTLELLGNALKDKIVFFNRPMNAKRINTGYAYGEAVDQRVHGASRASKFGAKAVLVRSVTTQKDDLPHTGVQVYQEGVEPIPSIAISTNAADALSTILNEDKKATVYIKNTSRMLGDVTSYNVVAEIKGSEFPDEIILVGGHLDSWDVGGGAHDDGSGCVHSMQVLQTLSNLGYKPKRTIRCVLFMNEENGLGGGKAYAEASNKRGEFHLAAIESDSGGFTPRGFTCTGEAAVLPKYLANLQSFDVFLEPYDLYLKPGGGGADISPLKSQNGLLIGFKPDGQRYFDFHHTTADVFANVNVRELKLGAAAITSLVYLIDQLGL